MTGDLTLRGLTETVGLTVRHRGGVTDAYENVRVSFSARTSITRSRFGVTHELAKEAGNLLVGRDGAIDIDVGAVRPA